MKEDEDEQSPYAGGAAGAGEAFSPSDISDEEGAPAQPSRPVTAVPIGRPVSDAEYSRLKHRAGTQDAPSGAPSQEDPSRRKRRRTRET